jgi:hypothetical protein
MVRKGSSVRVRQRALRVSVLLRGVVDLPDAADAARVVVKVPRRYRAGRYRVAGFSDHVDRGASREAYSTGSSRICASRSRSCSRCAARGRPPRARTGRCRRGARPARQSCRAPGAGGRGRVSSGSPGACWWQTRPSGAATSATPLHGRSPRRRPRRLIRCRCSAAPRCRAPPAGDGVELDTCSLEAPALVVRAEVDAVAPAVRPDPGADGHVRPSRQACVSIAPLARGAVALALPPPWA